MKNVLAYKRLMLSAALLACVFQTSAFGVEEEEKELLRTLKRGVDDQIASVEFKCSYTYGSSGITVGGFTFRHRF